MTYRPQLPKAFSPQLPKAFSLVELPAVGSTNDYAKGLAREGAAAFTIVWTHDQTAGKGRQGNSWTSVPGNLYMTMLLRPGTNAAQTGQLSFVAAVALAETLQELLPAAVQVNLKWPNDLLLNGKKSAGILLEAEEGWVVVGMGVNLTGAPEGAASLSDFGVKVSSGHVLERLAQRLKSLHDVWLQNGFAPVRSEWLRYAHNIGNTINVRLPKETFTAKFIGIDDAGALQVELQDGSRRQISSGEVFSA